MGSFGMAFSSVIVTVILTEDGILDPVCVWIPWWMIM